jgi:hypothetical protein
VVLASTHNNIAHMLLSLHRPAEALVHYQLAFKVKINSSGKEGETIAALGISDALSAMGKDEEAETFLTLALIPILESGDLSSIVQYASRLQSRVVANIPGKCFRLLYTRFIVEEMGGPGNVQRSVSFPQIAV